VDRYRKKISVYAGCGNFAGPTLYAGFFHANLPRCVVDVRQARWRYRIACLFICDSRYVEDRHAPREIKMARVEIPTHLRSNQGNLVHGDFYWVDVKLHDGRVLRGLVSQGAFITGTFNAADGARERGKLGWWVARIGLMQSYFTLTYRTERLK
jgi:hypothetical protein